MADLARKAVVLGGSMAGLLAGRALSNHFDEVAILERDLLPTDAENRKGVPQGNHAHGLLASGYRILDTYFPGMIDDLEAAGASRGDTVGRFLWYQYGGWKLRHESGLIGITVSRPGLETAVRSRMRSLPNVTFVEGVDIEQPVYDAATRRVSGALVSDRKTGEQRTIPAALVVDATGRGSQSPKWLQAWGFAGPTTTSVKVDVGYATRYFERKPGDLHDSAGAVIAGTPPQSTRYAAVIASEGERWTVTLAGVCGDYPPTDEAGWLDWAKTLPVADVYDLASANAPIGDITSYRFPANQRRHYEKLRDFPEGYLVIGDAICSFNPIYGQGMSTAAMEAKALDECLAEGKTGLAPRFFKRAAKVADIPWLIATGEDFRYPQVEGKRPPMHGLINRYLERVHHVATYDAEVCRSFMQVVNLLAPPASLMSPRVMRRAFFSRPPSGNGAAPSPERG